MPHSLLFDKNTLERHRQRAAHYYENHKLYRLVCDHIISDLADLTNVNFDKVADLCSRDFYFLNNLNQAIPTIKEMHGYDIIKPLPLAEHTLSNTKIVTATYNLEQFKLPEKKFNIIVAPLILHVVDNLSLYLQQVYHGLADNGIFMGTLFSSNNLIELRKAFLEVETNHYNKISYRILPTIDVKNAGSLLKQAGFSEVVTSTQALKFVFPSFKDMLYTIKNAGESNCLLKRNKHLGDNKMFKLVEQYYINNFTYYATNLENNDINPKKRLFATIDVLYLFGRK